MNNALLVIWFIVVFVGMIYVGLYRTYKKKYLTWRQLGIFVFGLLVGAIPWYILFNYAVELAAGKLMQY